MNLADRPKSRCIRCGGWYDAIAGFAPAGTDRLQHAYRRPACIGCEQTQRDATKQRDRWAIKARDTLRRHAYKYGLKPLEFSARFGWQIARIAHDLKHAFENTCAYCWHAYSGMPNGLASITLDIRDRGLPPHYWTNVQVCCETCNREKAGMSAEMWALRLQYWQQWHEQQQRGPEPVQGNLFD